ncbi:hypothetical protein [Bacteroides sp. An322]|uniref:hypothetical protein n=1 Tax=Bacteroides sp. An322 TaxID=1965632 RepID=UPI000B370770|nr:hypothetical protein [Bacteroides sp. An322]OUO14725.1 hypothetical protein B5F91_13840 [Bacteroides sp. An322]
MICYTLSDCILKNLERAPNRKEIITDILMVFAQNNNHHKLAIDRDGKIIQIYSNIQNPAIAYWLQLMADFPCSWEPISIENIDNAKTDEEIFLLVCSQTFDKTLIVYNHNGWTQKLYEEDKVISYNGTYIKVFDREEAIKLFSSPENCSQPPLIIKNSIIAQDRSHINNVKLTHNEK